ncbi:hypothetical protein FLL45_16845 [Aliikangiella marina]|uniref:DUF6671 domain-containing protein n=1 Tax=Aliikangiella marina TaxID=1712262 RepID=A0A545T7C2_9GAMM|nr:DUF6671 family protein [Aliikangiella marina]TQV73121.1 hypothetical protein FLL45_16845 [Aliikangiella marina]
MASSTKLYELKNAKAAMLTKHGKASLIKPSLHKFGIDIVTTEAFDTDLLGTFSGEVERTMTPQNCAARKARLACELTGLELGIGSEGSFGGGPYPGLVNWDTEIIVLYDSRWDKEITAVVSGPFSVGKIKTESLEDLKKQIANHSSQQAWIFRGPEKNHKGLQSFQAVYSALQASALIENDELTESLSLEPDLRAMHCPERQNYIRQTAEQLAQRIQSLCPSCAIPDFWPTDVERGLACRSCGRPTKSIRAKISVCSECNHSEVVNVDREAAEPAECQWCNP